MKTTELTGAALDWAAAKCEQDNEIEINDGVCVWFEDDGYKLWNPSTNWSQGGVIIERELMAIRAHNGPEWSAEFSSADAQKRLATFSTGSTPLVAAMRCYVASKLGDDVEIPEALK